MSKIIVLIIALFCLFFFYEGDLVHFSERVYFTSQAIMIFSTIMVFNNDGRPYSLRKMFYLFSFFFFGIAPLVQYHAGTSSFEARLLREEEYFHLNVLLLIIMMLYEAFYNFYSKNKTVHNISFIDKFEVKELSVKQTIAILILSSFSFLLVFYMNGFNINSLIFRGGELAGMSSEDILVGSSINLIFTQTFRPLAMICLLYYIISPKKKIIVTLILFIFSILTIFPTGVARFYAAAVYIPLIILSFKIFEKNNIFSILFIGGLLVIFPFLNNFRHFSKTTQLNFKVDFGMFTEGHFDSYQNFALIYFENIITYGRQLLGVLFFWMPRSVWANKPIGSGYLLAERLKFSWPNVSANFFAEGYINFGYFGVLLFILILSYATSLLDNLYWGKVALRKNNFFKAVYLVLLGMLFFMMRGDLLSSTAFTVGFMVSIYIVYKLIKSA